MFDVRVRVLIFMTARRLGSTGSAPVGQIEPFTSINLPTLSTVPRNRERTSPALWPVVCVVREQVALLSPLADALY